MICLLALFVFSILSIFGATYRKIALEAFDCVFRRITLRKCTSGLDKRLKSGITGSLMKKNPVIAKFTYKHFDLISWFFTILLFVSLIYTAIGGYNYYLYGNCNGPNDDAFCIFDPTGHNTEYSSCESENFPNSATAKKELVRPNLNISNHILLSYAGEDAPAIIQFGCFKCTYTKEVVGSVEKIIDNYGDKINFVFVDVPIAEHDLSFEPSVIANCYYELNKPGFNDLYFSIFENQENLDSEADLLNLIPVEFREDVKSCINDDETKLKVDENSNLAKETGIYGTPTFFIGDNSIVGPRPYRVYKNLIEEVLN